jgi:aspartate racemase
MKKAGIIGGLGPASTLVYYKEIIDGYRAIAGEDCYPDIIINSINMTQLLDYVASGDMDALAGMVVQSIEDLANAGAGFAAIASNTPHIAINEITRKSALPLISIVDVNCTYAKEKGYKNIAVIGTKFTMNSGLYSKPMQQKGINAFVPDAQDIETIQHLIFPDLENGIVNKEDKKRMIDISEKYIRKHSCDALLLGCTEIPLMIKENDISVPVINTMQVHIDAIIKEL